MSLAAVAIANERSSLELRFAVVASSAPARLAIAIVHHGAAAAAAIHDDITLENLS